VADSALAGCFWAAGAGLAGAFPLEEEFAAPFEMAGGLNGLFVAAVAPIDWEG
jgi:hypothetical protein